MLLTSVTINSAIAPVAAEIMPGRPRKGDDHRNTERGVQPHPGSTPAIMENAMASGMSASATTKPASRSLRILESHS